MGQKGRGGWHKMTAKGARSLVTNLPDPGEEGRERAMDLIITRRRGTPSEEHPCRYHPLWYLPLLKVSMCIAVHGTCPCSSGRCEGVSCDGGRGGE